MSKKSSNVSTKSDIVLSAIALVCEIGIGLFLLVFTISFFLKAGATLPKYFKDDFNKHEYAQSLISKDNVLTVDNDIFFFDSEDLLIVQSGEANDNHIIIYYWFASINCIIAAAFILVILEKIRLFLSTENVENPFTDKSVSLFGGVIKYFAIIMLFEVVLWILCSIFTPFSMKFFVDVDIVVIAIVFFVYYLLRKGNELLEKKSK